jgi:hypothetical protein
VHKNYPKDYVDPIPEAEKSFLGQKLHLRRATQPSNIIWENRHNTWQMLLFKITLVVIFITGILIGSLYLFIFMMKKTVNN